jgi:protein-S-isoprenylcysteine O-methyltransferase Ste14
MTRIAFFIYGVVCHLLFLLVYAYMVGFVGNILVPISIDSGPAAPLGTAIAIDVLLIVLFTLPHSVMARPSFKQAWTRIVPKPIERSTYVLFSCVLMVLLMWQWRPIGDVIWDVQSTAAKGLLYGLFAFGWLMVPMVSLLINHFDLFGTRQVWLHLKGKPYTHLPFRTPMIYKRIRHPLYVGWMTAFWAIPTMTLGHLLFASLMTVYMLIAIWFEERNLVEHFGDAYVRYQSRVPVLVPRPGTGVRSEQELNMPVKS